MKPNYILEVDAGELISHVAIRAKELARKHGVVEFTFNGVRLIVEHDTDLSKTLDYYDKSLGLVRP